MELAIYSICLLRVLGMLGRLKRAFLPEISVVAGPGTPRSAWGQLGPCSNKLCGLVRAGQIHMASLDGEDCGRFLDVRNLAFVWTVCGNSLDIFCSGECGVMRAT